MVVVRSAVTGPDSNCVLSCQHTRVPFHMISHQVILKWHWANQPCSKPKWWTLTLRRATIFQSLTWPDRGSTCYHWPSTERSTH